MLCMQLNESTFWKFSIYYPREHRFGDITRKSVSSATLLGITIDSKLNFKEDISNIKEAYYKLYTLRSLQKFLT